MKKQFYTIGYGGRKPEDFQRLLREREIKAIVDVRLRPDKASMGVFVKAKTEDKGIQKLLAEVGIQYFSLVELGNLFLDYPDWRSLYRQLLQQTGYLLLTRLDNIPHPFCLLCAEKKVTDCHREQIGEHLQGYGYILVEHIQ
jgi:uncharacterized protein (DUF488 family)